MKKSILLSSLAVCTLLITATNAYSATTFKFQTQGVTASMTACLNNCDGLAGVTLDSGQSNGQTTWLVFFDIYGHDSQGNLTVIEGVGQIPSSMVSGNGITSLTLNLDTNAAGLDAQYCVADAFDNFTCTPFSGGVMNITWTPTKTFSGSGTTVDQGTSGPLKLQFNISGDFSSANTESNIFGQQYLDTGFSQLGNVHSGQIAITQP